MMKRQTLLWMLVILMSGIFAVPKTAFTRDSRLEGRWYMNGDRDKPTEINSDRRGLEARNENGQTSRLKVDRNGKIRALDWQGTRGDLRGDRIRWDNGTTWTRRPSGRGKR